MSNPLRNMYLTGIVATLAVFVTRLVIDQLRHGKIDLGSATMSGAACAIAWGIAIYARKHRKPQQKVSSSE